MLEALKTLTNFLTEQVSLVASYFYTALSSLSYATLIQIGIIIGVIVICLVLRNILVGIIGKILSVFKAHWFSIIVTALVVAGVATNFFVDLAQRFYVLSPKEMLQLSPFRQGVLTKTYLDSAIGTDIPIENTMPPGGGGCIVDIKYQLPSSPEPMRIKILLKDALGINLVLDRMAELDEKISLQIPYVPIMIGGKKGQIEIYLDGYLDWVEPLEDYSSTERSE